MILDCRSSLLRQPRRAPASAPCSTAQQASARPASWRSTRRSPPGSQGRRVDVTVAAASDDAKPNYKEIEKRGQDDVASARKEAAARVQQVLSSFRDQQAAAAANSSSSGTGASGAKAPAMSQAAAAAAAAELAALQSSIQRAIVVMQEGLVERETEVRLILLAALAGEHMLLIGPPGTAKSEVARRLNTLVTGTYFERLLTRFSVPEELFGPLSMRALEADQYMRQTEGYLPQAQVAFIDEIFKANSAILNTLLTLINERLFDNGNQRQPVPLITLVGASNELPESEELDALYDRFLLRRAVRQVSPGGVAQMLAYYTSGEQPDSGSAATAAAAASSSGSGGSRALLGGEQIRAVRRAALRSVRVPQRVVQLVTDLRGYLQDKVEPPVYVSDRRLVKALQCLQVAAYCNGRSEVSEYDCLLLQHMLWHTPDQADRIADWLMGQLSVDDGMASARFLLSGLFSRACRCLGDKVKMPEVLEDVRQLQSTLMDRYGGVAAALEGGFPVVLNNLWLGAEEAAAVATALEPKLMKTKAAVEQVVYDICLLTIALEKGMSAVSLANLMPSYWADFIRNAEVKDVKPIGTTPLMNKP